MGKRSEAGSPELGPPTLVLADEDILAVAVRVCPAPLLLVDSAAVANCTVLHTGQLIGLRGRHAPLGGAVAPASIGVLGGACTNTARVAWAAVRAPKKPVAGSLMVISACTLSQEDGAGATALQGTCS